MTTLCKIDKFRYCLYVSCIKYHESMAYEQAFYYAKKGGLYGKWGWMPQSFTDHYGFFGIDVYKEFVYNDDI